MFKKIVIGLLLLPLVAWGEVGIDMDAFGESLGGWSKGRKKFVTYEYAGSTYRSYPPETTPTPGGGTFVSLRIDYRRSWMASDDHAMLMVTFSKTGEVESARSTLAMQGRSISSDLIRNTAKAGDTLGAPGQAVKVGTDLVADLSSKLLREKTVEAGRVSFPAAIQHNFNLLYQAVRVQNTKPPDIMGAGVDKDATLEPAKHAPEKDGDKLKIENFGSESK